jgi:FKBP-type peptidyl-prolyl cis-trans isomerase 2
VFDASYERGSPFPYNYGQEILQGWDIAMNGARAGMKRRLVIPAPLAYGERGRREAKIGPNATIVVALDVLNVERVEQPPAQPAVQTPVPAGAQPVQAAPTEEKKPQ